MIIVVYTADKALEALLTEKVGIIMKAFAAIVADKICAVSAVGLLTGRKGMVGTFLNSFHTLKAYFTVKTIFLSTIEAEQTIPAYIFIVLLTDVAMILRGAPTIFAEIAKMAHFRIFTIIAGFAAYAGVLHHTVRAVVIVIARLVFVYRARRSVHKASTAGFTMCVESIPAVITTQTSVTCVVDVFATIYTMILRIDHTVCAEVTGVTNLILGECFAAFFAMVLFVAIARLRVFGAVWSAVAEPVVKSVAAAILTFGTILVSCKYRQCRCRKCPKHHHEYKQHTHNSFHNFMFHKFPPLEKFFLFTKACFYF